MKLYSVLSFFSFSTQGSTKLFISTNPQEYFVCTFVGSHHKVHISFPKPWMSILSCYSLLSFFTLQLQLSVVLVRVYVTLLTTVSNPKIFPKR